MSDYNGWTNYATWAVKLWMDNEQSSQEYWAEQAQEFVNAHDDPAMRTILFADAIEAAHVEALPELQGFAADLLNAAIGSVNWHEIAANLLEGVEVSA